MIAFKDISRNPGPARFCLTLLPLSERDRGHVAYAAGPVCSANSATRMVSAGARAG